MTLPRSFLAAVLLAAAPGFAAAQTPVDKLPDGAQVTKLDVRPAAVKVTGPFGYTQLLVTATLDNGETADVTRLAAFELPKGFTQTAGLVRATADGTGVIGITVGGKKVEVPATAAGVAATDVPVSFVTDVQPVLSKLGCNAGTCHGAAQGKNGFKLSLRGYDPLFDFRALTDDLEGRRFNRSAPERSLMLLKPTGAVPHQGGVAMQFGDPNYELVLRWIGQGLKLDLGATRVKSIEVFPKDPTVNRLGQRQQFAVLATYADGRVRDVTAEAFLESSNTEIATVDKTGLVSALRRGEATMLARYEGAYAASTVVVMGDRTGFAWEPRPVHNFIDELVDAKLKKVKVQASPLAGDEEFVRRVHLDLTGLPPSADEVRAFVADGRDTRVKRDELVDKLVGSEAFVEHWTNKWADLLQVNRKFLGPAGAAAFRAWIRDRVAENMPYDKFAYEVLTASGSNMANPPASYFKILRTPDDVMENTTQLFLAVRFNCNKCHDHPFERWTQDQYFNLAAYFAQVSRTDDPKYKGQKIGVTAVTPQGFPAAEVIADAKAGDVKHERTGEVVKPQFPYPVAAELPAADPRRVQVARWVTSAKNPYFAKSYVNRIWGYLLGVGIIEPLDDIRAGNPATNPELLDKLTEEFVAGGFDVRKLIKTVCKSRTYQLSVATNRWNKDDEINYSHALARRLPAEVLFDAIHKATGSASKIPGLPPGSRAAQLVDSSVELPGGFLDLLGKPVRESACECERTGGLNLGPILAMVNGPIVGDAVRDPENRINKLALAEKDDGKVVDEIYLSVLNRLPRKGEREAGVAALRAADKDLAAMKAEHQAKAAAFTEYSKTLDDKQKAWEAGLRTMKPTEWTAVEVHRANSQHGPPATRVPGATLTVGKDGTVTASGKLDSRDVYTVVGLADPGAPVTAIRLEALSDPGLPAKGPGRADNGNFVLSEFRVNARPLDRPDANAPAVKLTAVAQTFQQEGFAAARAVDGDRATGWAVAPQLGRDHAAVFRFEKPVGGPAGVALTVQLDHEYQQAANHVIGKFRLSVTTDPNPRLGSPLTPEQTAVLATPPEARTAEQKAKFRALYLAQDREYQRLQAEAANAPPADARVLGAQDLVWALINSPAFLFNR
ncbi:MAG: hypothetical protein C0501_03840 [Isosphaera sp.]|nr:hypothetical protein [Isosphaera sp.]